MSTGALLPFAVGLMIFLYFLTVLFHSLLVFMLLKISNKFLKDIIFHFEMNTPFVVGAITTIAGGSAFSVGADLYGFKSFFWALAVGLLLSFISHGYSLQKHCVVAGGRGNVVIKKWFISYSISLVALILALAVEFFLLRMLVSLGR